MASKGSKNSSPSSNKGGTSGSRAETANKGSRDRNRKGTFKSQDLKGSTRRIYSSNSSMEGSNSKKGQAEVREAQTSNLTLGDLIMEDSTNSRHNLSNNKKDLMMYSRTLK